MTFPCTFIQYMPLDAAKTYREVEMDENVLNQVIAQHLYQEGYFEIAEQFEKVRSFLCCCLNDTYVLLKYQWSFCDQGSPCAL